MVELEFERGVWEEVAIGETSGILYLSYEDDTSSMYRFYVGETKPVDATTGVPISPNGDLTICLPYTLESPNKLFVISFGRKWSARW